MKKSDGSNINIGKVKRDVVISKDQSGGVTSYNYISKPSLLTRKPFYKKILFWVGVIATVLTILGYFGPQPKSNKNADKDSINHQKANGK